MPKFKVGDRVRVITSSNIVKAGWCGVVLDDSEIPYVQFDHPFPHGHNARGRGREGCCFSISDYELELIEDRSLSTMEVDGRCSYPREGVTKPKKPFMTQVNTMMKKLLDADTRALIEAGYLNSELELTCEGNLELQAIQFEAHKKELVELAKAKLAEEKKK